MEAFEAIAREGYHGSERYLDVEARALLPKASGTQELEVAR